MTWRSTETRIAVLRQSLLDGIEPGSVLEKVRQALSDNGWSRCERARLDGLEMTICVTLGDIDGARNAYRSALEREVTPAVEAEVEAQHARLCAMAGRLEEAEKSAARAVGLASRLPLEIAGHPATRRRRRWNRYVLAGAQVVAGDVARQQGDLSTAYERARAALEAAEIRSVAWLAAVSLLGVLCIAAPLEIVCGVLAIVKATRGDIRNKKKLTVPRVKLLWVEALALARLGSARRAAQLLEERVIPMLENRPVDLAEALEHLVWVVGDRDGNHGRAAYLRRSLSAEPTLD